MSNLFRIEINSNMINVTIEDRNFVFNDEQVSRLWIIGNTGTGKSTFALELSRALGVSILEAGTFARELFGKGDASYLSEKSQELLQNDWRHFSNKIEEALKDNSYIVSGVRNPVDFVDNFNPKTDYVFILHADVLPGSRFEETGIEAIRGNLDFLIANSIFDADRLFYLVAKKQRKNWYEIRSDFTYKSCSDW